MQLTYVPDPSKADGQLGTGSFAGGVPKDYTPTPNPGGADGIDGSAGTTTNAVQTISGATYVPNPNRADGQSPDPSDPPPPPPDFKFVFSPSALILGWTDNNGSFTGDLAAFNATADFSSVTALDFTGSGVSTIDGPFSATPALSVLSASQNPGLTSVGSLTGLSQLTSVDFSGAGISALDVSGLVNLSSVSTTFCAALQVINVSGCSGLVQLVCQQNPITSLDLDSSAGLQVLVASGTSLESLSLPSLPSCTTLDLSSNGNLTSVSLPSLTSCTDLDLTGSTALSTFSAPNLVTVTGNFVIDVQVISSLDLSSLTTAPNLRLLAANSSLTSLSLPSLTACTTIDLSNCQSLLTVSTPNLATVATDFLISGATDLGSVNMDSLVTVGGYLLIILTGQNFHTASFPSLISVGNFYINNNNTLTTLSAPVLQTVTSFSQMGDNDALVTLAFPSIVTFHDGIDVGANGLMTSISLPAATSIGNILADASLALTTFSAPNWVPRDGGSYTFFGCALDQTSVDAILSQAAASMLTGGKIDLSGFFNAIPSTQDDVATLMSDGVTVLVDS